MARNMYDQLPDPQLADFIAQAVGAFSAGDPALYGLTPAKVTALQNAGTALGSAITAAIATEAAFRADIQAKENARQTALDNVSLCAGLMYATPGVTDEMVAAAGFQPRDTEKTPIVPQEPTGLFATPNANGTVFLGWTRNGNPYGVDFVIEVSADGSSWAQQTVTKKKSVTLEGFAPGVAKWFRVKAVNRGLTSVPSLPVSIYAPGGEAQLQIAA